MSLVRYAQLCLLQVALFLIGTRRVMGLLRKLLSRCSAGGQNREERAEMLARQIERTARVGRLRDSCLPRSILLWWLLRRQGILTRLRLGVKGNGKAVRAHAWVELRGRPLGADRDQSSGFSAFPGLTPGFRRKRAAWRLPADQTG
jgi:hypothetical protein